MSVDVVSDIEPRVQYTAAAAQTDFDYPFPIFTDADLVVDVDGVTQALTTDYTVTGAGDDTGGTVTLLVAATGNEVVTIYRDIAIDRLTDFQQNGRFSSSSFNDELDKIILIQQQLDARINRALRFPMISGATSAQAELSPIASWYGKAIKIDETGTPVPLTLTEGTVADLATRQVFTATQGQTAFTIAGGYTVGAVDVHLNGSKLVATEDFTATNGSTVVLAVEAVEDDRIDITAWSINPSYLPRYYEATAAEGAAAVTIADYSWPPGDVRRYGGVGDDSTANDNALTAAVAQCAQTGGAAVYIPPGTFRHATAIAALAGVTVRGEGVASILKQTTASAANFSVAVANVTFDSLHFQGGLDAATTGRIMLDAATHTTVKDCWFTNLTHIGVHSTGATTDLRVTGCRFHTWISPLNGSSAINVYNNMDTLTVTDNIIDGGCTSSSTGADFGISILRSTGSGLFENLNISNNHVERVREYGIVVYANEDNTINTNISGNTVDYVYGSDDNTSSGAGIYLLRPGHTTVTGNNVAHTNQSTAASSLAPGAIGVNGAYGNLVITGNTISSPAWQGIHLVSGAAASSVVVNANTVYNPGKIGIYAFIQSNVKITSNTVTTTTGDAGVAAIVALGAVGTHIDNISIVGNQIVAAGDLQATMTYVDSAIFANNNVEMSQATGIAVQLSACDRAVVAGNMVNSSSTDNVALLLSAVTAGRVSGNYLLCNHSNQYYGTTSTCTDTFADESNGLATATNAGTGSAVVLRSAASPAAGTYQTGDRCWDKDVASGAAMGWIYASAAWKAMAVIA